MMQSFIPFLQIFLLLLIGGTALALLLLPEATMALAISLGLPLGALINIALIFLYTVLSVPLSLVSVALGHLVIIGVMISLIYFRPVLLMDLERPAPRTQDRQRTTMERVVFMMSLIIIAMNVIYSAVHATLLPTVQYDSATNWTMRSEISFVDQHIAFDTDERRGMAKPQYPFLFHALQIAANQGQLRWNDRAANGILYLLSIASFSAVFLMIRKIRGITQALASIAVIIAVPLIGIHLAQGYGDINLLQYCLLSLACLAMWSESKSPRKNRWLVLSAVFVAAAVWTKSEGLVFGLIPWVLTVAIICGRQKSSWSSALPALIIALVLSVPWPLFAWMNGLSLTPHSSDTLLQFHPEGMKEALLGLFSRGSFGVTWYILTIFVPTIVFAGWKRHPMVCRKLTPLLVWGSFTCAEILFIYLCTPNVRFLLNAESFYRQMMIPAALLICACSLCLRFQNVARENTVASSL